MKNQREGLCGYAMGMWFYECGAPFNATAARQFEIVIEATAQYGSGYKPPSPYQFG
jgi:hypothetical protein